MKTNDNFVTLGENDVSKKFEKVRGRPLWSLRLGLLINYLGF